MLFQVKQTYNADDLWALHNVEKKKYRVHRGVAVYIKICALMGILVLVGTLVGSTVWTIGALEDPIFIFAVSITLIWAFFIPGAILILAQVAFLRKERINEDSLRECKERTYTFFDDHFRIEEDSSTIENQYSVIKKFIEKDDHFFIYIAVNTAYVIRKSCFTAGMPEDFGPFMREKYRTKGMDTPEKGLEKHE